jgi:hypothetical protein
LWFIELECGRSGQGGSALVEMSRRSLLECFRIGGVLAPLCLATTARADATITVDGNLSDWPSPVFTFQDNSTDLLFPWRDIQQVWVTNDNDSGSNGNLYVALEFRSNFQERVFGVDIDVYVHLDLDGDGQLGGPYDRTIEATDGVVTDGDGNVVGSIAAMAYAGPTMEIAIPYSVLGLAYGSDDFGIAFETNGWPGIRDYSPNAGEGDGGFITYPGTDPVPLAVTLAEFSASAGPRGVTVQWSTASERNNLGFHVYRVGRGGQWLQLTEQPLAGLGDSALGRDYRLFDAQGRAGTRYVIEDLDASGAATAHGPVQARWQRPRVGLVERVRARAEPRRRRGRAWRGARHASRGRSSTAVKLAVRESGLNMIGTEALIAGGLDASRSERRGIALQRADGSVPVLVTEHGTLFVGMPELDRYADYEVVQARVGRGAMMDERAVSGACMAPLSELPAQVEAEEQRLYYVKSPVDDPLYWAQTLAGHPATLRFAVPAVGSGAAELTLHATGIANVHAVSLALNGHELGAVSWTGGSLAPLRVNVPEGVLAADNELVVELVPGAEFDLVSIDRVAIQYSRRLLVGPDELTFEAEIGTCVRVGGAGDDVVVLDVTEPAHPQLLGGYVAEAGGALRFVDDAPAPGGVRRYLIGSTDGALPAPEVLGVSTRRRLRARRQPADSLVITHPDFAEAAARLADHHRGRGYATLVVSTDEVYDGFSFGRPGADPIGALLRDARRRWRRPPAYVTLVGGSTVDSHGHLSGSRPDFVPTPFYTARTSGYQAASDGWYVSDASGKPWAAIGRLAVGSAAEAEAVVDKLLAGDLELASPTGKLLLVADSYDGWDESTDAFEQAAARLAETCAREQVEPELLLKSESADAGAELLEQPGVAGQHHGAKLHWRPPVCAAFLHVFRRCLRGAVGRIAGVVAPGQSGWRCAACHGVDQHGGSAGAGGAGAPAGLPPGFGRCRHRGGGAPRRQGGIGRRRPGHGRPAAHLRSARRPDHAESLALALALAAGGILCGRDGLRGHPSIDSRAPGR